MLNNKKTEVRRESDFSFLNKLFEIIRYIIEAKPQLEIGRLNLEWSYSFQFVPLYVHFGL